MIAANKIAEMSA